MSAGISAPEKMTAIGTNGGIVRWVPESEEEEPPAPLTSTPRTMPLLRNEMGQILRKLRLAEGMSLRDVSGPAVISLGYISEVERGKKEVSSEMLSAICGALGVSLAVFLREVADCIALAEGAEVPHTMPNGFKDGFLQNL